MKKAILFISLFAGMSVLLGPPDPAEQAFAAMRAGENESAIALFDEAFTKAPDQVYAIRYNQGLCAERGDTNSLALKYYQQSQSELFAHINSRALNNSGVIYTETESKERALEKWKDALRADPDNELARYNYELFLKRFPPEEETPPPPEDDSEEENPGQTIKQPNPQPPPPSELNALPPDEGPEMDMDQARAILRGMAGKEKKYLQELKKYPVQKEPRDGSKNW